MKIKSRSRFSDDVTISSGAKALTLHVDLDLTACAQALRKAREEVAQAQNDAVKDRTEETARTYGQALRRLISVVFGVMQTDQLLTFYEGRPEAMIEDVMPYIFRRIVPLVTAASKRRAAEIRREVRRSARGTK